MNVLFVCLGNICRSPAAEAIFASLVAERGDLDVEVDSAGTSGYHIGEPPHRGTVTEARRRGVAIDHHCRQVTDEDFEHFDLLVAMDRSNQQNLRKMAPRGTDLDRIVLFGSFAHDADSTGPVDVADPWGHPQDAFAEMWDHLTELSLGLLAHVASPAIRECRRDGDIL